MLACMLCVLSCMCRTMQAHAGWAADEDMEDEEEMLRSMAAQRDAAIRAARESERMMEGAHAR